MMTDRKRAAIDMDVNNSPKRSKRETHQNHQIVKVLKDLDSNVLGNVLIQLLNKHPWLCADVSNLITLSVPMVMEILNSKLKILYKSLPLGPPTNDYSYSRVKVGYHELLESVSFYANYFINLPDSIDWIDTTASYLLMASDILLNKLIRWDNQQHEEARRATYSQLQNGWEKLLQIVGYKSSQGKIFSQVTIGKWGECLWAGRDVGNGKNIFRDFFTNLGWLLPSTDRSKYELLLKE